MSNENSEQTQPKIQLNHECSNINGLPDKTSELSDEESELVIGGQSKFELNNEQLESVVMSISKGGIRITGF